MSMDLALPTITLKHSQDDSVSGLPLSEIWILQEAQ